MSDEKDKIDESWFNDWETDHGFPKDISDLYEMALCLYDDIPIGYEVSHKLASWIVHVHDHYKEYEIQLNNERLVTKGKDTNDICDSVDHPAHYTSGNIECIDAIEGSMSHEAFEGYLKGNIFKYLWRYRYKNAALEDLRKAQWYQNKLIEHVMNSSLGLLH